MVHIALCGDIPMNENPVPSTITRCAQRLGITQPIVQVFSSALELLDHLDNAAAEPLYDLIVIHADSAGMSGIQVACDARKAAFAGEICLVETSTAQAFEAQRLHVSAYWVTPLDEDRLEADLTAALTRLATLDAASTTMRMRSGLRRVPFAQFVYAQTANHDQVLHMRDGSTMQLRCSSQDLFDHLASDPRFLKLGSSYIVNLDLVSSMSIAGGSLTFIDGSTASVPVRFRKPVQDALFARAESRKHG